MTSVRKGGAHDEFLKLWTGYTIAKVGSQITVLALPLTAVLLLGAGATETGLLVADAPAVRRRSVVAATNFIGFVVAPPAALGAGLLGDAIGLRPTLFIAGVIGVLAFLYLLASPVRSFRSAPESAAID